MGVFVFYCVYVSFYVAQSPNRLQRSLGGGGYAVVERATLAKFVVAGDRL